MRLRITSGGQVSVPASIRRRWGTSHVSAEDRGDSLVLRPAPDDPVEAVYGIFAQETSGAPPLEDVRRDEREAEAAAEARSHGA